LIFSASTGDASGEATAQVAATGAIEVGDATAGVQSGDARNMQPVTYPQPLPETLSLHTDAAAKAVFAFTVRRAADGLAAGESFRPHQAFVRATHVDSGAFVCCSWEALFISQLANCCLTGSKDDTAVPGASNCAKAVPGASNCAKAVPVAPSRRSSSRLHLPLMRSTCILKTSYSLEPARRRCTCPIRGSPAVCILRTSQVLNFDQASRRTSGRRRATPERTARPFPRQTSLARPTAAAGCMT